MKRVLVVFGTRPEAIKMAPVIHGLRKSSVLKPVILATAQHRQLLDQVVDFFQIVPDLDLDIMRSNQGLFDVTTDCLQKLKVVFDEVKPDCVLVQGDTATAFVAALAAFYARVPIAHVEAGLRTGDRKAPFPEEGFRRLISEIADLHFAPTESAAQQLRNEQIPASDVFVTGNTGIDALLWTANQNLEYPHLGNLIGDRKMVLMTAHRRENFGEPFQAIFAEVREFALAHPEMQIIYPVHPNPNVKGLATEFFGDLANVALIEPVSYPELVYLMKRAVFIMTDSGGIQEEAPSFGKQVLVLRETTERPEAVEAGWAHLVGCDRPKLRAWAEQLLNISYFPQAAATLPANPFGDGNATGRIVEELERALAPLAPVTTLSFNRPIAEGEAETKISVHAAAMAMTVPTQSDSPQLH